MKALGTSKGRSGNREQSELALFLDMLRAERGAHRNGQEVVEATGNKIGQALAEFDAMTPEAIRKARREKFLGIGRLS